VPAEVLYRKWRPQRFAEVSGQDVVKRTLLNALKSGKVSHAYLFAGPRGTGKTTMGRLLTKAINCERNRDTSGDRPGEPCNECASCVAYNEARALDLVELDGASNRGIEEIRRLRENAGYAPMAGMDAHKVYLIDEVHMLTDAAFNALLKTLEEPPPHIVFILATTDAHKVPATITSRCQRMEFKRIPTAAIVERLAFIAGEEGIQAPREGLELIARGATGSLRDAINLLEQVCDSYGRELSIEAIREGLGLISDERTPIVVEQALRGDVGQALATLNAVRDDGIDLRQFQREVTERLRTLLLAQAGALEAGAYTPEQFAELNTAAGSAPREQIVRLLKLWSEADLRDDPLSPVPLEIALVEAASPPPPTSAPQRPATATVGAPVRQQTSSIASAQRPMPQRPSQQRPPNGPAQPPARPAIAGGREVPPPHADGPPRREFRRDNITGASPEDIARMVGSKAPVIDDTPDAAPAEAPAAGPALTRNGVQTRNGEIDLSTWVHDVLRPKMRQSDPRLGPKLDAVLNGSCHAVSFQDGVLTIGFYQDAYSKRQVEGEYRSRFEAVASELLGEPVAIRCIIAPKPTRQLKSPLVQHAVERGARIVSQE